ncbi:GNAT family N-acetyltransferase [Metasolibacillus meyeri]|uniref:GNAT family N-acetyltransferase n=1 Tax=Metasolibacillus meyeri TaxID=1071052 RepID=A0AAW9NTY2_9BACL|nr:GNAT family N-acetyltransferase [Metasolibacillus meyeri]MEC1179817.1 GNAT family N-acetyltransferase [Metasolibacillus meyeri]
MIRLLTAADHDICMELVQQQPAENLFIIGDIEAFGYDQPFQKIWGQFEEDKLIAVLLKYESNYVPYTQEAFDVEGFAEIINADEKMTDLSGLKHIIDQLEPFIGKELFKKQELYYAKCTALKKIYPEQDLQAVEKLTRDTIEENVALLKTIPEFASSPTTVESKLRVLESNTGRTYFMREAGVMVSSASTTAENSLSAMVVGVATHANYKKKGYATKCMQKLCGELLDEGRSLCLFYDNPAAGAIYKRLGFEDIGFWNMLRYQK